MAAFAVGDMVEVTGMPDNSDLNGTVGTLVKTIGKGRWALKVEGEERTKVVMEDNLKKYEPQADAKPKEKFTIVGTWDDWEPQEMKWNQGASCFEYGITLGHDGAESFKILVDGDWDHCVYPDRKDACPHQAHQVKGPDDGGLDEEWTVGMHEADKASTGDKFTIKFFVSHDGKPKRVTWEKIGGTQEVEAPPQKAPVGKFSSRAEEAEEAPREVAATPSRPAPAARRFDDLEEAKAPPTKPRWMREPEEPEEIPKQRGGHNWMSWADARAGDDVVEIERAARERLAKRLEDAAQLGMDMPMIADGSEDDPYKPERMRLTLAREEEERAGQVEANKERYRRSVEESVRERAAATKAKPRIKVPCQDCGQVNPSCMATVMYGSIMVCDTCLENWEALKEEGWGGDKLCGGLPAAQRVNQLVRANKGQMTPHEARLEVMREYAPSFRIN